MRVDLNLAGRPFGRSRLFWLLAGLGGALAGWAALWLITTFVMNRDPSPELAAAEQRLEAQLQQVSAEEATLRSQLGTPETMDVYDRSHFLNQLLVRKGISWTRTFRDIETTLPPRVLMMQLRPAVTEENQVELEMQVGAETPGDFIELLKALEGAEMFQAPEVRGYNPPNENMPYHRYQLTVRYDQQL